MFYIPSNSSTIGDVPFGLEDGCDLQLVSYSPKHTPQSLFDTQFWALFKYNLMYHVLCLHVLYVCMCHPDEGYCSRNVDV